MAGSLNKVMLIGNLGQDPEVRSFQNGGKVCNLRIATSEQWKDRNTGERQERTEWHTVAIFSEGLINVCENYLKKGSKVFIEGKLQTRKWQDQNGQDRYSTEVVLRGFDGTLTMLDGPGGGQRGGGVVIAVGDADEKNNARSVERPHHLSADGHACVGSALENCPHRCSVPRRGASLVRPSF